MVKKNNYIQGYVLLDTTTFTEQDWEYLNKIMREYLLIFDELKTINGRTLYYLAIKDKNKLKDQTDEEGNVTLGVLSLFANRDPEILGVWDIDGTPFGQVKNITPAVYDNEDNLISEEIVSYEGEILYPLNKTKYLAYMDDIIIYDQEGNEESKTRPTECKPIRLFAGFKEQVM